MIQRVVVFAMLASGFADRLAAQDTAVAGPMAERLRHQIEVRFGERLSEELGLTDGQSVKVRGILATWAVKRRNLEREDRQQRAELSAAMRPGVAANDQAVSRLVDAILATRGAMVQTFQDEMAELGTVLSPVQRAQYLLLRDRLLQRVQELRQERQAEGGRPPLARRLRPR